jgi:phage FluMu protein Com
MSDSDGSFSKVEHWCKVACPKCKQQNVIYRIWESHCGGYEDYKYECKTEGCGHTWWVDGIDS